MIKNKESNIKIGVDVDTEKLQDTADILKEMCSDRPNITIRDNGNVYVTMNYFNATQKEYMKDED